MKLFHVERASASRIYKGLIPLLASLLFHSCATMRDRDTIPDYIIREGGKSVTGSGPLYAFIFEDTRQDATFQGFLVAKLRHNDTRETEFPVTISNTRFKILYYDNADFEKYFRASDYIPTVTVTAGEDNINKPRFIALSMVDESNQDCLSPQSLWYNTATEYLKKNKDEYLAHARP